MRGLIYATVSLKSKFKFSAKYNSLSFLRDLLSLTHKSQA